VVNNLTRLRPTRRERYRATIFGSARVPEVHWVYAAGAMWPRSSPAWDATLFTGGGPGLMAAANEGMRRAEPGAVGRSVGIRVELPFEQEVNAFGTDAYEHRTFFTRLHQFVLMSDAFVVVPGGIGTVLEAMMIWQLLQVGHLKGTPFILPGKMYADLVAWCQR
jgi:predicted Rossmann-fold nucleotide-binding protein